MLKTVASAGAVLMFATVTASAADLPSRAAPPVFVPPPVVGYNWSGLEFGLTTSYAFSDRQTVTTVGNDANANAVAAGLRPGSLPMRKYGFDDVGGGVGYNYQFTPGTGIVIGGMVDFDYFSLSKNNYAFAPQVGATSPSQSYFHQRLGYLATVNGRLGYAFDRFLVYGTGGFAFGEVHAATIFSNYGLGQTYYGTRNATQTGYDFGGGVEYAIPTDSILNYLSVEKLLGLDKTLGLAVFDGTIRGEFIHYDLGSQNVLVNSLGNGPAGSYTSRFKTEGNLVRVGLGYKYNSVPSPIVARY